MKIYGIQKLTLTDYPGHTACILFTSLCNFRCPFCHNSSLVENTEEEIPLDEIFSYLEKRRNMLEGVVITGGEPTLNDDLIPFIDRIKSLGYLVKLDSNGYKSEVLREVIKKKKVDYIAMDVKNGPSRYPETVGLKSVNLEKIKESISLIINSGIDYEFRTTLSKELHRKEDIKEMGEMINGAKRFFFQNFEDSDGVTNHHFTPFKEKEIKEFIKIISPYVKEVSFR